MRPRIPKPASLVFIGGDPSHHADPHLFRAGTHHYDNLNTHDDFRWGLFWRVASTIRQARSVLYGLAKKANELKNAKFYWRTLPGNFPGNFAISSITEFFYNMD